MRRRSARNQAGGHVSAPAAVASRRRIPHRSGSPCRAASPTPPAGRAATRWPVRPTTVRRPSRPRPPIRATVTCDGGWRTRSPDGSTPTSCQNRSTLGWYASRVIALVRKAVVAACILATAVLLIRMDLETMATDRAGEVLVRAVRHQRDEVQADVFVGSDVMEEDLVVAVRARRGRDLSEVLRLSRAPAEDHDQSMSSDTTVSRLRAPSTSPGTRP